MVFSMNSNKFHFLAIIYRHHQKTNLEFYTPSNKITHLNIITWKRNDNIIL